MAKKTGAALRRELRDFRAFGKTTVISKMDGVPVFTNEFWTARQRQSHSLHEISYRACFKAELPRFFIERLTEPGDTVLDPFMGRGTTLIEAALLGRRAIGNDINPLGPALAMPRLDPPSLADIEARLQSIDLSKRVKAPAELKVFYHPDTLRQIAALRDYLLRREKAHKLDPVDAWIRMVAVNRLTGHSSGFFSVYTLPPNQAVSVASQKRINARRRQTPVRRDVAAIILKKSRALLKDHKGGKIDLASLKHQCLVGSADRLRGIKSQSIDLIVTSPPFLDVVAYADDNWLRCWFAGIDVAEVGIAHHRRVEDWRAFIRRCFKAFARVVRPGGHIAFEVGEVRGGRLALEPVVLDAAKGLGFSAQAVLVNAQRFTKTANTWGVANNAKGTNSNRIVLFQKN